MMRRLLFLILGAALAACSTTDDNLEVFRGIVLPNQQDFSARFQRAAAAQTPQMRIFLVEYDTGSLIHLDSSRQGVQTWVMPDGATLMTQDQFIVGTRGLGIGLLSADISEPLAMVKSGQQGVTDRFHTYLTGNDDTVTRTYRCQIVLQGTQDVVLTTGSVETYLYSEDCRSLDQEFQNLYWVIPASNRIVQTSQWTGEFVGAIATQVVP